MYEVCSNRAKTEAEFMKIEINKWNINFLQNNSIGIQYSEWIFN